jgi:hypothetical protein
MLSKVLEYQISDILAAQLPDLLFLVYTYGTWAIMHYGKIPDVK